MRRAADQFLNARIQATLETMDVEMLTQGKQKIRVSYLRSAGIKNMWHLSKMSRQQIEALYGIGAQGAAAIYDLTKQIVKNAKEKLSVRIQTDSPMGLSLHILQVKNIHVPAPTFAKELVL